MKPGSPWMPSDRGASAVSRLLRGRGYRPLALLLTLFVWLVIDFAMRPRAGADGSYGLQPYGLTTGLENQALDLLFQLRDARRPGLRERGAREPILIIGIDDESILSAGVRAQNWPRSDFARLIDMASAGGASVIGLDLLLTGESGSSEESRQQDQALAEAIRRAGNVVIGERTAGGGAPAIAPSPMFADAAWATGFLDLPLDSDGAVRCAAVRLLPPGEKEWRLSLAARLAEGHRLALLYAKELAALRARGVDEAAAASRATASARRGALLIQDPDGSLRSGDRRVPLRTYDLLQLDFRARPPAFTSVSAGRLLRGGAAALPPDAFRDRIVLIARTSLAGGDYFATPFYETSGLARLLRAGAPAAPARTSGAEIQATAAATLLDGESPARPAPGWGRLFILLPLLLTAGAVFRLRAWLALAAVLLIGIAVLIAAAWAFNAAARVLPLADAWLGMVLLTPAGLALRHARERALRDATEQERARMMAIFSSCVSPAVAEQLWRQRDRVVMTGERRMVTLMFTDIRDFTTLSEASASDRVVEWLTEYFARMNTVVTAHGGHISKFIGDGLMIVFGAPLARSPEEEARAALDCGLAMLDEVARINRDWAGGERPVLRIGVGLHTGEATCGVVGSPQRLEYTVIGDTVNVAARLESKTKELGVPLLLSRATATLLDGRHPLRSLGEIELKGKSVKVEVFTVATP